MEARQLGPRFQVVKTPYSTSMSSLWTPAGEHYPKKEPPDGAGDAPAGAPFGGDDSPVDPLQVDAQAEVDAMRHQLANTPAEIVVANHCYGLFELAAIYLSQAPPMLFQAQLAIDGLGGSYGLERLAHYKMLPEMGPPETTIWEFPRGDDSWAAETIAFVDDIRLGRTASPGLTEGIQTLEIVEAIYQKSGYTTQ